MKLAYVDSSYLLAIAFDEPRAKAMAQSLSRFDALFSSNLLEAEVRAALAREQIADSGEALFLSITWVFPNRPLTREFGQVLLAGHLKGADLWHLACALFLAPDGKELSFLTLDNRQRQVAAALGFSR